MYAVWVLDSVLAKICADVASMCAQVATVNCSPRAHVATSLLTISREGKSVGKSCLGYGFLFVSYWSCNVTSLVAVPLVFGAV